ncbi:MAG: hypothetical protein JST89_13205 [Cyanobacteria bacterium SZAS-4]|nr:hypothetical protein [Cyanobacteria bacterium SZAS-4]
MADINKIGDSAVASTPERSTLSTQSADLLSDFKTIVGSQQPQDSTKAPLDGLASNDDLLKQISDQLDKNPIVTGQGAEGGAIDSTATLAKLDQYDDVLRNLYRQGLPTQPDEMAALNQIVSSDQSMNDVQNAVATDTSLSAEDIVDRLQKAVDKQISSREDLGDVALKAGDGSTALAAYESALKMQLNNTFASPQAGEELLNKIGAFGISKEEAISSATGGAEQQSE